MATFELKLEVPRDAAPALEELLAEREEQRLMVLEDKPSGRAWLSGYFGSPAEAGAAWQELAAVAAADGAKTERWCGSCPMRIGRTATKCISRRGSSAG